MAASQEKLSFKPITKTERATQIATEEIDHKAEKLKAEILESNQDNLVIPNMCHAGLLRLSN